MDEFMEKRNSPRYPLEAIVVYHIQNYPAYSNADLTEIDRPRTVDLSYEGMQFVTGQPLETGSHLKIILYPAPAGLPLEMIGEVIWANKIPEQFNYRVGVSFLEYLDGCDAALRQLIGRMEEN